MAGNTFKTPVEFQEKQAKITSIVFFIFSLFFILLYVMDLFHINSRLLFFCFVIPVTIYSFYGITVAIKNYIKYGE